MPDSAANLSSKSYPGANLGELIDRVGRMTRGLQYTAGLSPAQWEALRFIARANRYTCNPSALAAFLGATKGTISQTVIALGNKGYLRRVRDSRDRRAVRLELTAAGEALLADDPLFRVDQLAAELEGPARTALVDGLNQLLDGLRRRRDGKSFGVCGDCCLFCADDAFDHSAGPHRCGLTGEPLSDDDSRRICISCQSAA